MTSTPSTTDRARETAGTAQHEGSALAQSAKESGSQVASTAGAEASHVASEAKAQATDLLRTTRDEVNTQVDTQRRRLVDALRTTGDELNSGDGQSALTSELSQRASTYARRFADYLDERGPDAVLNDVRSFARRKPGTFLLLAGAAGVVAGRVFRSVSAASSDSGTSQQTRQSFVDDDVPSYRDTTYSGLGVGATETIPSTPGVAPYADDVAVGVAEVPPAAGTGYVPPATGYVAPEAYPPVPEPPLSEPYPPTGAGYGTDEPGYRDSAYPAAPAGAPAADPYPPVTPATEDPFADPRFREPRQDER
ncbi:hypothetical protein [Cryptosporangium sp. NPDC048952]|uniref:hypothetical protein n=1 Tax=Cryptosporangium sp. NPDC048952 TaxID=3363961 RepID=UPI0037192C07